MTLSIPDDVLRGHTPPDYAELHCLSNFSFLRGASHPAELVQRAAKLNYHAIAITDECSFSGVVRAHVAARDAHIKLIIGSELTLVDGLRVVVLVKNRAGYSALSRLITNGRRNAEKGQYQLERSDLVQTLQHCSLIWLPGWSPRSEEGQWLQQHFANDCWIGVERLLEAHETLSVSHWQTLSQTLGLPLLACGDVHMHLRSRRILQDTVCAIRHNCTLSEAGHYLFQNGERHLRSREKLARLYPPAWLAETVRLAGLCQFSLDELHYEYPQEIVPAHLTPKDYLHELTWAGAHQRYGVLIPDKVTQQIHHELALIHELNYERYFLTVYDIVNFAREQQILCQGRGSAANSAVCYCLAITEVNPNEANLLFERFISRERNEPPDIDVDFEHERREEVIQYIYKKYGRERAGLTATLITYRSRSALRDVGKALGWDGAQLAHLAQALRRMSESSDLAQRLRQHGFDPHSQEINKLLWLSRQLKGFPRHLSQHVGGFVIAANALSDLVPVENATMKERTVIQWDKNDIDELKLLKIDVLSLGMLTALRKALSHVTETRGKPFKLSDIPQNDEATYKMIQRADTVGVFQIESRAQMSMLPRLKPENFYDLVVEVAIVRPGPIQGNMVQPYLSRREGREPVSYPSPEIKSILERTYGVSIFQEQAMQIAIVAAGFTPGEADHLRRAMGRFKNDGDLEPFRDKLLNGMQQRGYAEEFSLRLYEQLKGFGSYGFPESHAASFALLAYCSAWLKCHEPAAFSCALINSQPMGFYSNYQLLQDALHHGVKVLPIDVQHSEWDCTLVNIDSGNPATTMTGDMTKISITKPQAIRLGLRLISGFSSDTAKIIDRKRREKTFLSVIDLAQRCALSSEDVDKLASANALHALSGHRHKAHWFADGIDTGNTLFGIHALNEALPLLRTPDDWQNLHADMNSFHATLGPHPLALLRPRLDKWRLKSAADVNDCEDQQTVQIAGLVTNRQTPGTAKGVTFMTLEDETGQINAVIWASVMERYLKACTTGYLLVFSGIVQRTESVVHVVVRSVSDLTQWLDGVEISSRDFH